MLLTKYDTIIYGDIMKDELKKEDYEEPRCLLNMDIDSDESTHVDVRRIIERLDDYYWKNNLKGALEFLDYWYNESKKLHNDELLLSILNERMGYFRKQGYIKEGLNSIEESQNVLKRLHGVDEIYVGTTYVNIATVYKTFNMSEQALPFYEKAKVIYEQKLEKNDILIAGLYNNMGLALVDLNRFDEAILLYQKAIDILNQYQYEYLDIAITYLNMANLYEKKLGLIEATNIIEDLLSKAMTLLDQVYTKNIGYYAYVCDTCSSTFSYYGYFSYASILKERAKKIYERS